MNKYKIVSLFLGIALLASLVHLVATHRRADLLGQNLNTTGSAAAVFQNIQSRKSVRSFIDRPVTRQQIDTLLRAAMAAPSGRDMRPWKFVVIEKGPVFEKLGNALPYAKMLPEAAAAIVVCGDSTVTGKDGKPSGNWTFDCSAASENLLLMAEAMGLGAVWTGVYPYPDRVKAVKEALNLPPGYTPLNLIPIGYPKGDPAPKDKYNEKNIIYM